MKHSVEVIVPAIDSINCGGDSHYLMEFKSLKAALSYAIKASMRDTLNGFKVYEITVRTYDNDEELTAVRYYSKGINTYSDLNIG